MPRLVSAAVLVPVLLLALASRGGEPTATPAPPANAVQQEMRLLEAAMRDSVSAIAAGDVRALPKKLHAVHMAADATKKATGEGAYRPPVHGDQLEAFRALDDAFHQEMIEMVKAARKNDVPRTAELFGKLMTRCHGCHAQFRHPPPLK